MTRIQHGAVRQGVQTAADVVFSGESLGDALKHNAPMVMIDAVQGYAAQRIGEWYHGTEEEFIAAQDKRLENSNDDIDNIIFTSRETSLLEDVTHKLMHSALGAGMAAIKHEDIVAGAIAAPLGEMISETYGKYQKSQIQQDYKDKKITIEQVSERLESAKINAIEVAKVSTAVLALFTGRDVNTAAGAAGNAAENNFVPVLVAGAVIGLQIATVVDAIETSLKFKKAIERGDTDAAIAEGVALAMLTVPGQKLIPAPLRKAVHGVVTKSVTRILHSKYGQAAVKAGGAVVDAASSKVGDLANKAANSKAGQAFSNSKVGQGLQKAGDRLVQHVEGTAAQQAEKGVANDIDLRVKNEHIKQPSKLLPNEGKVGTYEDLDMIAKVGDNISAHHMPSAGFMEHYGVKRSEGIAMMVQEPKPGIGGRHRKTRTYGRPTKLDETPRDALARDIMDMRLIYKSDGVYTHEIQNGLKQVIQYNKESFPKLFGGKNGTN